jgi:hypothetical protein
LLRIPVQKAAIAEQMLPLFADGTIWAEGIEAGREPPEYARIPDALWVDARPDLSGMRVPPGIGRTHVDFTFSTLRRRTGRDEILEIRSVRIPTDCLENLWSAPGIIERMRRTYPALLQPQPDEPGMDATSHRTGFAGRPSGRHLVAAEMERRAKSGELKSSLRAEANELAKWYAATHPKTPSIQAGTIRNSLADLHRRLIREENEIELYDDSSGGTKSGTKLF